MTANPFAAAVPGTVQELSSTAAVVVEAAGARWQVPRSRLPATVGVGDRVVLTAFAEVTEQQSLARTLLNELLAPPVA